ncbi:Ferric enterobactin transport system permease protein fepD [Moraxella caviae]|nr:Ferric enterobactin transport system permease protein fepD [Moraxella caviae]VEW11233.1 Ferric enterobactin transport system permease protein fepD [Moraxella caviae]
MQKPMQEHTTHASSDSPSLILRTFAMLRARPEWVCLLLLVVSSLVFLTWGVQSWEFALPLRSQKLIALCVVGFAIGTSTLLFQTLTHNPILTPALLGFDALYVLINSVLVLFLGVVHFSTMNPLVKFGIEVGLMLGMSLLMFRFLFTKDRQDLTRLILVGVVFGVLFRSLSSLVARLINPDDFITVQAASYAQFNTINTQLLTVSVIVCVLAGVMMWRLRHQCDVLLLGKSCAINLGIDYRKLSLALLSIIALLVAVSTALVGPVTFLGLLVCAITNQLTRSMHHAKRLVLVALVSMLVLVLGQALFEHGLKMAGVLSVVIELVGGVVFLLLIFKEYRLKDGRVL